MILRPFSRIMRIFVLSFCFLFYLLSELQIKAGYFIRNILYFYQNMLDKAYPPDIIMLEDVFSSA